MLSLARPRAAALFDVDGTLVPPPSLERRLFALLRCRGAAIPLKNYLLWLGEALRLAPRGIGAVRHANKMYLRGAQAFLEEGGIKPAPAFFRQAVERIVWHAEQGHAIALVTGTIHVLAKAAARALEAELIKLGCGAAIRVCATRLEEIDGLWTGRILGEPMFGEAKARAAQRMARLTDIPLAHSYAYGDSASDRWLLEVAGHPAAVNPSVRLTRIAARRGWPTLNWQDARREQSHPSTSTAGLRASRDTEDGPLQERNLEPIR